MTPEGIEKTKPAKELQKGEKTMAPNSWRIATFVSGIIIVGLLAYNIFGGRNKVRIEESLTKSIAVLPFEDMSPQKDQEYFCDGMTEEIINALTHVEGLKVIARTSAFAFKGKHEDIREIGNKLDVKTLLEGSIRKDGNRLRITAQLIKVSDGSHLWSKRFDRDMNDVFAIQDEISLAIVDNLKVKLLGEEKAVIVKRPTEDLEAYNLFLQGEYFRLKLTGDGDQKAIEYYEQALQKDPNFARAYIGIADVHYNLSFIGVPPIEAIPRAIAYANKALEMDNTIAEAYIRLGDISMTYDWDWEAAEQYFKQALQLNPNLASPFANISVLLTYTGRSEEAIAEALRAQVLDPLSGWTNVVVARAYYIDHQFDRAIEEYKIVLAMHPDDVMILIFLGMSYGAKSMYKEAIAVYEKTVELSGGEAVAMALLAITYYQFGEKAKADELFDIVKQRSKDGYVPPVSLYLIHKIQGEEDLAYEWFERAVNQHDSNLLYLIVDPDLKDRIPDEPRYNALLKKIGLEKYQQ